VHATDGQPGSGSGGRSPDMTPVREALARVRDRARSLLLIRRAGPILGALLAGAAVLGVFDYLVRLPAGLRIILWLGALGAIAWAVRRWIVPALRFRPSLTEIALRVERTQEARDSGLSGLLASGLDLAEREHPNALEAGLSQRVIDDAAERFTRIDPADVLAPARVWKGVQPAALAAAFVLLLTLISPTLTAIGAARVLTPWSGVEWPKRTMVVDATTAEVHPAGQALPLRAIVTRTNRPEGQTEVEARYRIVTDGKAGPVRRAQLTAQGRRTVTGEHEGELFERLIEPPSSVQPDQDVELVYWFQTLDDETDERRVLLVEPPAVVDASVTITPPPYASRALAAESMFVSGERDLGEGLDERAVVGPVLAGSRVEMTIAFNKPIPVPAGDARRAWLTSALGLDAWPEGLDASIEDDAWRLSWSIAESVRMPLSVTDEHGLSSPEDTAFHFGALIDREPTSTMIEPSRDESVLPTAVVDLVGESRDDVGVRWVALERQHAVADEGSIGAAPEAQSDPVEIARLRPEEDQDNPVPRQAQLAASLDLSTLELKAGDELWVTALAADIFEIDGVTHDPVRSAPRRLRIIDESELIDQLRAELGGVRQAAIRLDEQQQELTGIVERGVVSRETNRRQAQLTERLENQSRLVEDLERRAERNRLADQTLADTLGDAREFLDQAAQASQRAGEQIEQARAESEQSDDARPSDESVREATDEQERVRDELGGLIEMLDRGEDSWVVRRSLERLLEAQKQVQEQTQSIGQQTVGRDAQNLTPQEKSELARIAERQSEIARRAGEALDELNQRSREMRDVDRPQSEAMQRAAQRGRSEQLEQSLEEAAQQVGQNQTGQAQSTQQQAIEAMEEMLEELDQAQRNRDEALKRVLASVIESIEALITVQERQIQRLEEARVSGAFDGLADAMIALNTNTIATSSEVRASDNAMRTIADLLDSAADAQSDAIVLLRRDVIDPDGALDGERESLMILREALEEAKKLQEEASDRSKQQKLRELKRAYRDALEQQVALRGDTDPFVGERLDRRQRASVRGLGERQDALRVSLAELRAETEDLDETLMFDYAHERLDALTGRAAERLRAGNPDRVVARSQDSSVTLLQSMLEALRDATPEEEDFRDAASGGGGGGGGGSGGEEPLIPPVAELKLLRALQTEAYDLTRLANEEQDSEIVRDVTTLQRDIAERGAEALKRAAEQNGSPPVEMSPQ